MQKYTYPNCIIVTYPCYPYKMTSERNRFTYKKDNIEFSGTMIEAREFFRNKYPSKSIEFRHSLKTYGY